MWDYGLCFAVNSTGMAENSVCAFIHTEAQRCFVDHAFKKLDRLLRCFLICSVCVCVCDALPACLPVCRLVGMYFSVFECVQ